MLTQLLALEKRLFKKADNWGGVQGGGRVDRQAARAMAAAAPGLPPPSPALLTPWLPAAAHPADLLIKETQRRNTFLLYRAGPQRQ